MIEAGIVAAVFTLGVLTSLALILGTIWARDKYPQRIEHVHPPCEMCGGASDGAQCGNDGRYAWLCFGCKIENDEYESAMMPDDSEDDGEEYE